LSIRGSQDQFTGDKTYNKWEASLEQSAQNTKFVRIEGADHFWSNRTQMASLLSEVSTWLKSGGDVGG
jgi:alpha/beta superfamily hydrolase